MLEFSESSESSSENEPRDKTLSANVALVDDDVKYFEGQQIFLDSLLQTTGALLRSLLNSSINAGHSSKFIHSPTSPDDGMVQGSKAEKEF